MFRCLPSTPRCDGADSANSGTVEFMTEQNYDVIIVGAGFGGIGAAVQLKRLGFQTKSPRGRYHRIEIILVNNDA